MKKLIIALLGFVSYGCTVMGSDSSTDASSQGSVVQVEVQEPDQPTVGIDRGPCGRKEGSVSTQVDGQTLTIDVPAACNPYYKDRGDPPDTSVQTNSNDTVDPAIVSAPSVTSAVK